jgi:hypothetical protein
MGENRITDGQDREQSAALRERDPRGDNVGGRLTLTNVARRAVQLRRLVRRRALWLNEIARIERQ